MIEDVFASNHLSSKYYKVKSIFFSDRYWNFKVEYIVFTIKKIYCLVHYFKKTRTDTLQHNRLLLYPN